MSSTGTTAPQPGGTVSRAPVTSVITTLRPLEPASSGTSAIPSQRDGATTTSAAAYQSRGSAALPTSDTPSPASAASRSRHGPSPTSTRPEPGTALRTAGHALSRTSCPFCWLSRPTHTASGPSARESLLRAAARSTGA